MQRCNEYHGIHMIYDVLGFSYKGCQSVMHCLSIHFKINLFALLFWFTGQIMVKDTQDFCVQIRVNCFRSLNFKGSGRSSPERSKTLLRKMYKGALEFITFILWNTSSFVTQIKKSSWVTYQTWQIVEILSHFLKFFRSGLWPLHICST